MANYDYNMSNHFSDSAVSEIAVFSGEVFFPASETGGDNKT